MLWPEKNTAFVVIHGTGAHKPFWILDLFVRNFWKYLESGNNTLEVKWKHGLLPHKENEWTESYISLIRKNKPRLDFYEYYWDIYMSGTSGITIYDLGNLLKVASDGAKSFYKENRKLANRYEIDGIPLFKAGEFITGGYLRILRYFNFIVKILSSLSINSRVIKFLTSETLRYFVNIMADFIIYLNPDVRSDYYMVRKRILEGAVEEIKTLIGNKEYEQIIIVAYSLGSAIAYDALNFINRQCKPIEGIEKIRGLVTLGSPLDKVAFFFHEHPESKEFVRGQLLEQYHGFNKKEYDKWQGYPTIDRFKECLKHGGFKWLNFWHKVDMVSGKLDWYDFDEVKNRNIRCNYYARSSFEAHTHYWKWPAMYKEITKTFFN